MIGKIALAALLLASAAMLGGCLSRTDVEQSRRDLAVGKLAGNAAFGQSFVSTHAYLSGIDVMLAAYARVNTRDVVFHLRSDASSREDLVRMTFNAAGVADNRFRRFDFEPLADSKGRSYFFFFTSPDSTPENSITMWKATEDVYAGGTAFKDGQPVDGDLVFKTYYRETISLGRIASFVARKFNGDRPFFIVYCSFLVLLLAATVKAWRGPHRRSKRNS
jgi:hypothetical protein